MSPTSFPPGALAVKLRPTRSGTGTGCALGEAEASRPRLAGLKAQFAHESADQLQTGSDTPPAQLGLDAPIAVGAVGAFKDFPDERLQFLAPPGRGGFRTGSPVVVAGPGHAEQMTHELDAVCVLRRVESHLVDELVLARYRE